MSVPEKSALLRRLWRLIVAAKELHALIVALPLDEERRALVATALSRIEDAIVMAGHAAGVTPRGIDDDRS